MLNMLVCYKDVNAVITLMFVFCKLLVLYLFKEYRIIIYTTLNTEDIILRENARVSAYKSK